MADFKISYKGTGIEQPFDYICPECKHECEIVQCRSEPMDNHTCPACKKAVMLRHITAAPSLDADFHYQCHSSNI